MIFGDCNPHSRLNLSDYWSGGDYTWKPENFKWFCKIICHHWTQWCSVHRTVITDSIDNSNITAKTGVTWYKLWCSYFCMSFMTFANSFYAPHSWTSTFSSLCVWFNILPDMPPKPVIAVWNTTCSCKSACVLIWLNYEEVDNNAHLKKLGVQWCEIATDTKQRKQIDCIREVLWIVKQLKRKINSPVLGSYFCLCSWNSVQMKTICFIYFLHIHKCNFRFCALPTDPDVVF